MNKIDLIERLLDEKKITFKEALLLNGETQVKDLTPPIAKDVWDAPDITIIRRILETVLPKPNPYINKDKMITTQTYGDNINYPYMDIPDKLRFNVDLSRRQKGGTD